MLPFQSWHTGEKRRFRLNPRCNAAAVAFASAEQFQSENALKAKQRPSLRRNNGLLFPASPDGSLGGGASAVERLHSRAFPAPLRPRQSRALSLEGEGARLSETTAKPSDGFREQVHHRPLYMIRRSGRVRPPFCFLAWRSAVGTRRASSWPVPPAWRNLPSGARRGRPEPCGSGRYRPETGRKSAWNKTSRFHGRRR